MGVRWAALSLLLTACGGALPFGATDRVADRTEIVYLATFGEAHRASEDYGLSALEAALRAVAPEVVLVDLPPEAFAAGGAVGEGWLAGRPDLEEVVVPVARELGVEVVPASGWTPAARDDWERYWAAHPDGPDESTYRRAVRAANAARREHGEVGDPVYVHGPAFLRHTGWVRRVLSTYAGAELGAADPQVFGDASLRRVWEAIAAHPGKRIAVVFDARQRWYLEPRLAQIPGVTLLDARGFFPED